MKIAIISSCSLPVPAVNGGAVESLIESIIRQNELQRKYNIDVYTIYDEQAVEVAKQYPHTKFVCLKKAKAVKMADNFVTSALRCVKGKKDIASRNYIWKLILLSKLKDRLKKETYDVIVIQNTIFLFDLFKDKKLFEKYKGKVYFHVHNSLVKTTKINHAQLLCRVISISDYLHDNIKEYLGKKIEIVTVHNGIQCDMFNKKISNNECLMLRKTYEIPNENKVIVFVGRIAPEKGIRETILAFNKLERQDCDLLVVGASYFGSGAISPFESEIINSIRKNPRIHLTGYIPKQEIWKFYALGDLAILPSMWEEPLGLTMIEAQAAGIPLITTISGGIPETVNEKYSILLARNTQIVEKMQGAMEEILNNLNAWKGKAQLAQQEVNQKYDESIFYQNFMSVLNMEKRV